MKKYRIVFVIMIACLCACNKSETPQPYVIEGYDNPMKEDGEGIKYKDFHITKLNTPSGLYLDNIQKIDFIDDKILIQNTEGVYSFNKEGNFIRQYGTKGHGPGEYVEVGGMIVDHSKKMVLVYDNFSRAIIQFELDGRYLATKRLKSEVLNYLFSADCYDGNYLFVNYFLYKTQNTAFALCDTTTFERNDILSYGMNTKETAERSGMHAYDIRDNVVKYVLPFKNEIYCHNRQGSFPIYQVLTKKKIMKSEELAKIDYNSVINYEYIHNDNIFLGFNDIFEMDSYILLNTLYNSYFLVDKKTMTGQRYSNLNLECLPLKYLPLLNIRTTTNGYLVGIVKSEELEQLEFEENNSDKNLELLKQYVDNKEDEKIYLLYYKI